MVEKRKPSFQFEPPQRTSLSQVVVEQILRLIRDGQLRPGDRLPSEAEMMRMLKLGRSSIREGLRGLSLLGVISTWPGKGTIVAEAAQSPFEHLHTGKIVKSQLQTLTLLDLLEVRESLEGQAAELAALRATDGEIAAIRRAGEQVAQDIATGRVYFRSNAEFHLAVARASHNRILERSVRLLIGQVRGLRERLMKQIPEMPGRDIDEHAEIVAAIAARRPKAAREAMVRHIHGFAALAREARETPGLPVQPGKRRKDASRPSSANGSGAAARKAGATKNESLLVVANRRKLPLHNVKGDE